MSPHSEHEPPDDPVTRADYALFLEEFGLADNAKSRQLFQSHHRGACRFLDRWDEDDDSE